MERPLVFEFTDFRAYLEHWQKWRQGRDASFTRTEVARRLGLPRTRSFFTDILRGKPLSATFLERLIPLLEHSKLEAQYFRAMVKFTQADSAQEREFYHDQLVSLNRSPRTLLDPRAFSYYKDWRNAALRAVLEMVDWDGKDPQVIVRKFQTRVTPGEIRRSMDVLRQLDLVEQDDNGFWKPRHQGLSSGDCGTDEAIRQHQLQCLQLVERAILERPIDPERDTSTMFLAVSDQAAEQVRRRLQAFRQEIRAIVHQDLQPSTRLLHLDLFLHPLVVVERSEEPASTSEVDVVQSA